MAFYYISLNRPGEHPRHEAPKPRSEFHTLQLSVILKYLMDFQKGLSKSTSQSRTGRLEVVSQVAVLAQTTGVLRETPQAREDHVGHDSNP